MKASSSVHPYGAAIAVGAAGMVLAWLSGEASGLLAVLTAVYICKDRCSRMRSIGICGLALGLFFLLPRFNLPPDIRVYLRFATLLTAVIAIGLLIRGKKRATSTDRAERQACLMAGSTPGLGSSTDAAGNVVYASPSVLDYADIDDQKEAGEALRSSEQQLRLLIDTIPALVWCATPNGTPSYLNKRMVDYTGMTLDSSDLLEGGCRPSLTRQAIIHPDELAELERLWFHSVRTGEPFSMRHRLRRADGVYRWVDARAEPLHDSDGRIVHWYGVDVDVDDNRQAEEALRGSERQLRLLIDAIPALVWCATPDGEPSYLNKRMADFTGLTFGSFGHLGGSVGSLARRAIVHPDELAELERLWSRAVQAGATLSMKHRLRRVDGLYRWVDLRAEPLRNDDGDIVQWYGVCVDIEDETRMQDELRAAQDKLSRASQAASLAELSASIAHEVNQPLAAVIANSHACQRWLSTEPPNLQRARITVERIIRDANGAAEVVSRIRALFKQTVSTRVPVNLNEVITEVCKLISDDVTKNNISIETDLEGSLPSTLVDCVQMQQVLINLTRNGIDAMESSNDYPKSLLIRSRRDGMNEVLVEVRDRGGGVEDVERIFEPFFTTKENGMGMGLAICRSIIEAHDGRLRAFKNEPRGTTLAFTLPAYSSESQ
ncbi:MAG: ATPase [Bradyrhizobium sp.]|nr:ATPase [Bradyrhizobium sp.]